MSIQCFRSYICNFSRIFIIFLSIHFRIANEATNSGKEDCKDALLILKEVPVYEPCFSLHFFYILLVYYGFFYTENRKYSSLVSIDLFKQLWKFGIHVTGNDSTVNTCLVFLPVLPLMLTVFITSSACDLVKNTYRTCYIANDCFFCLCFC